MATADATGAEVNSFEPVSVQLTNMLDELFSQESKTTMWTPNPVLVQGFKNSAEGKIPSIFTSGLANYAGSYYVGEAKTTFVPYVLRYNRAVQHRVDAVDLTKAGNVPMASAILANFARMSVIPELDATRITAVYDSIKGMAKHVKKDYTPTADSILSTIRAGINTIMDETGIDTGMTIHFNTKYKDLIEGSTEMTTVRNVTGDGAFDDRVPSIEGNRMVYTPSARMWSALTMENGALGDTNVQVGFKPTPTESREIVALITAPDTAQAIVAHEMTKIFGPEQVQDFDGSKVNYHVYHDCIVPEHRRPGVYAILSKVAGPSARGPETVEAVPASPSKKK